MMKLTKFMLGLILFCSLLVACSNDQFEEEVELFNIEDTQATDEEETPPMEPEPDDD